MGLVDRVASMLKMLMRMRITTPEAVDGDPFPADGVRLRGRYPSAKRNVLGVGSLVAAWSVVATCTLSTVRVVRVTRLFLDSAELPFSLRVYMWSLLLLLPL